VLLSTRRVRFSLTGDAWPQPGSKLPANRPIIILEGSGNARSAIGELGKQSLHLVADDDRVALRRIEILESRKSRTQLVLKAEEDLDTGSTYQLDTNRLKSNDSQVLPFLPWNRSIGSGPTTSPSCASATACAAANSTSNREPPTR